MSLTKQEMVTNVNISSLVFAKSAISARFETEAPESEELEHLVNSIKKDGINQPLIVRPSGKEKYEVIDGNRRLRAAKITHLEEIPIIVKDVNDREARRIAFVQNAVRKDYNGIQRAKGMAAIYKDAGVPKEIAIQLVKYVHNTGKTGRRKTGKPSEYMEDIIEKYWDKFIPVCSDIPYSPNYQYQCLQTVVQLPDETIAMLEREPNLGMNKALLLTYSGLRKHPEITSYLANIIKDPAITYKRASGIVRQAISDIETGVLSVSEKDNEGNRNVVIGIGGREYVNNEQQQLEQTFDVMIPELTGSMMSLIAKIIQRPRTKGEIMYTHKIVEPYLAQLEKNLSLVKREDKKFFAAQAAILSKVCRIIINSAR